MLLLHVLFFMFIIQKYTGKWFSCRILHKINTLMGFYFVTT